jgi:phosphoglucosamine mutase
LSEALANFSLYPQQLINIPIKEKLDLDSQIIKDLVKEAEMIMEGKGRVLIRPSGTQPLLRIMTEGPEKLLVVKAANYLAKAIN